MTSPEKEPAKAEVDELGAEADGKLNENSEEAKKKADEAKKKAEGIFKKPLDWMEKKFGTRSPKELLLKLDQFSKPLPKDVPKEKFHSYCGVLLSIVLYVVLGGFAYFTYTVL